LLNTAEYQSITAATASIFDTMAECDMLKVVFFPEKTHFPSVSARDYLKQTAADMLFLLKNQKPKKIHLYILAHQF